WDWTGVRTLYPGQGRDRRSNSCQGLERRAYRQDSRNYSGGLSGRRRSEKDLLDEHQAIDRQWHIPWSTPSERVAGTRSADQNERADEKRSSLRCGKQTETASASGVVRDH